MVYYTAMKHVRAISTFPFTVSFIMTMLTLVLVISLFGVRSVLAFDLEFDPEVGGEQVLKEASQLGDADPGFIVFTIVNTSLIFLGTITLIMIIIAGFMWLFAAGEEEKIKKAKDLLQGSIIGLVIVLSSYGLSQYIFTALRDAVTTATTTES